MKKLLTNRPSVHFLCLGAYLQAPVLLENEVVFVPLTPIGFEAPCTLIARYAQECGATVDQKAFQTLCAQGENADPVVAIVIPVDKWNDPQTAENTLFAKASRYRELLSWATGDDVTLFGVVTLGPKQMETFFRAIPLSSRRRIRLGFGNTDADFTRSLKALLAVAENDEHFAFALSMLHDANKETNIRFKIARLFCCLESLAYKLKKNRGSRNAVRYLLDLEKGPTGQAEIGGRIFKYDVILGAGILRDHLFHGVPIDFSPAKAEELDTFDLLEGYPERFVDDLLCRCEIELARWSNNASRGQN